MRNDFRRLEGNGWYIDLWGTNTNSLLYIFSLQFQKLSSSVIEFSETSEMTE